MARFKGTMAFGNIKEDIAVASYTTGNASADLEINVNSAVFTSSHSLIIALEHMMNMILDSDYPPA